MATSSFLTLIQAVRDFVNDRNWEQYHTPRNIALALGGECGELSAIFQWKHDPETVIQDLTREELIHLGEEISDVFIYNARLSDVLSIDIVQGLKAILFPLTQSASSTPHHLSPSSQTISLNFRHTIEQDLTFSDAVTLISNSNYFVGQISVRDLLFHINSTYGQISELFGSYGAAKPTINQWLEEDVTKLALGLSKIAIYLLHLTSLAKLDMATILSDKIRKNAKKYPVSLVKGSAKKYTAYQLQSVTQRLWAPLKFLISSPLLMFSFGAISSFGFILLAAEVAIEENANNVIIEV